MVGDCGMVGECGDSSDKCDLEKKWNKKEA